MYRVCDICGGVDDHPRHSFSGVINDNWPVDESLSGTVSANAEQAFHDGLVSFEEANAIICAYGDTTSTDRHIDCCASAGCPLAGTIDGCDIRAARAAGGTGQVMVDAAMAIRDENPEHYNPEG